MAEKWEEVAETTLEREFLVPLEVHDEEAPPIRGRPKPNDGFPAARWAFVRYAACSAALLGFAGTAALAAPFALSGAGRPFVKELAPLQQKYTWSQPEVPVVKRKKCRSDTVVPACPAIGLFYQPEVHKVALENILSVGNRLLSSTDMELVHDIVAASFQNVSRRMERAAPRLSIALQMIELSDDQQEAVLSCMQLISNPRVQQIGLEVARAIHTAPSLEYDAVKKHIHGKLGPLKQDIRMLRDEVVPKPLRQLWGLDHLWEMTLDMENLRIMAGNHSKPTGSDLPPTALKLQQTSLGVEIGALEESRALVNLVKQIARLNGQEVEVPREVTVSQKVRSEDLTCELSDLVQDSQDLMRAWFCPLKFGSQGVEALMAVSELPSKPRAEINLFQSLGRPHVLH